MQYLYPLQCPTVTQSFSRRVPRVCAVVDPSGVSVLEELAVTCMSGFVTTHLQLYCSELPACIRVSGGGGEGRVETKRQWNSAVMLIVADCCCCCWWWWRLTHICLFIHEFFVSPQTKTYVTVTELISNRLHVWLVFRFSVFLRG